MEGAEGALVIFGDVAGKAGKDVAFAVGAIVREGQPQHFAEKGVANVAHHIGTDYGDLDKGKVVEDVFASVEHHEDDGEVDQGMLRTKGDKPCVEPLEELGE